MQEDLTEAALPGFIAQLASSAEYHITTNLRTYQKEAGPFRSGSFWCSRHKDGCSLRCRHRWQVERSLSWLHQYRRLRIRYEQRDDIHQVFLLLFYSLVFWKQIQRLCYALLLDLFFT
jgi:hypothetical protein